MTLLRFPSILRPAPALAAAALLLLAAACTADSPPKQAQQTATAAGTVAVAATAGATAAAGAATTTPGGFTPPANATALTAKDYADVEAVALSCDGPTLLVLVTKSVTLYLQTFNAPNYQCEQARQTVIQNSGPGADSDPDSARGKIVSVSIKQLEPARTTGSYTVTFQWKGGASSLLTVVGGWQAPGS